MKIKSKILTAAVLTGIMSVLSTYNGTLSAAKPSASDPVLQQLQEAAQQEVANLMPRDKFYDAAATNAPAGSLIRAENYAGWKLPAGATGTRMLYNSRDASGKPDVTSAAVVVPAGQPPAGGWPVIAWAHGTSGVAQQCAPTLMKDLYYGDYLAGFLNAGYAVVATDYSGLGAGQDHQYIDSVANGNDVRYSVAAARSAVPTLSDRWIAVGHSQGGQAVWGAARQQVKEPVGQFLGAVALAPATAIDDMINNQAPSPGAAETAAGVAYRAYIVSSLERQYPDFKLQSVLDNGSMGMYKKDIDLCLASAWAESLTFTKDQFLRSDWLTNPSLRDLITKNTYDDIPVAGPLFVVSGQTDVLVPAQTVAAAVAKQCRLGTAVQYSEVPGGHDDTVSQSADAQLEWIANRFTGTSPAASTCP